MLVLTPLLLLPSWACPPGEGRPRPCVKHPRARPMQPRPLAPMERHPPRVCWTTTSSTRARGTPRARAFDRSASLPRAACSRRRCRRRSSSIRPWTLTRSSQPGRGRPERLPGRASSAWRAGRNAEVRARQAGRRVAGAAPVTWRCTRYVALHPLCGAAPEQKGCNAYGSGALPLGTSESVGGVWRGWGMSPWRCTRYVALHPLCGAAPVMWRCTRTEGV